MTISEIVKKVKRRMFATNKWAVLKWTNYEGQTRYALLRPFQVYDGTGDNGKGIALMMDDEYNPIVYPSTAANKYEFVGLEVHHPNNNLLRKYKIRKEDRHAIF